MKQHNFTDAVVKLRGTYDPRNLVASLSKEVDETLACYDPNFPPSNAVKDAFATYLHETIHWWQHAGTTSGLFMSLSLPAQAHANQNHFRTLSQNYGLKKPISDYLRYYKISTTSEEKTLNIIVNNWHDMYFSRLLLCMPKEAPNFINSPIYESQAHSHFIHFGSILAHMESVSKSISYKDKAKKWGETLEILKNKKANDFYFGSDVRLPSLGTTQIMEAHARFCDLQFRSNSGNPSTLDDFCQSGLLSERYLYAYTCFLRSTGLRWVLDVIDPSVNLFLFLCDYSLNPVYPYPYDPVDRFEEINELFSPGARFFKACTVLLNKDIMSKALKLAATPCVDAYIALDQIFSNRLGYHSVYEAYSTIQSLYTESGDSLEFESWQESFKYDGANIFTKFILSNHYEFVKCRIKCPHLLCWPAYFSSTRFVSETELTSFKAFFNKHEPPLLLDHNGVVKVNKQYLTNELLAPTLLGDLLSFFVMYDLSDDIVTERGLFDFSKYRWFADNFKVEDFKKWLEPNFRNFFGVRPGDIEVLEL